MRSTALLTVALVAAACLPACGGAVAEDADAERLDHGRSELGGNGPNAFALDYPGQYPSLQATVDAAPSGAIIRVAAGTRFEPLVVFGKRITVVGAGVNRTAFDGANVPTALVTIGGGADVTLRGLALSSPNDAIVGLSPNGGPAGSVFLDGVRVHGKTATSGSFVSVRARDVDAFGSDGIFTFKGRALVAFDRVTATAGPGASPAVFFDNRGGSATPCIVRMKDVAVRGGSAGGIVIAGGGCPVFLDHVWVDDARIMGIGLFGVTFANLLNVRVAGTGADATGKLGDGLFVHASNAIVRDSAFRNNARAGVSEFGCTADGTSSLVLDSTEFTCNAFAIDVERKSVISPTATCGDASFKIVDAGGNACDERCGGALTTCKAMTSDLAPISL